MCDVTELGRNDIVGHTLVEIIQKFTTEQGLDWAYSFYRLDSGVIFTLPDDDADGFAGETPPSDAEPIVHHLLDHVYGQRIADVLRESPDSEICHGSTYLLLSNGFLVTDVMAEYHGTGGAGVFIYSPNECDASQLVAFGK